MEAIPVVAKVRNSIRRSQKTEKRAGYRSILIVLGIVLLIRIVHLAFAIRSPLSFQLSPDEDYYMRFALSVAQGSGGSTVQFAFMDPVFGYIAGTVFKLFGSSLFALYLLQIVVDTFTAFCVFLIGRELRRPRAGLWAALIYGFTVTALLFCTSMLKTIWVANFMTLWVLGGLLLLRKPRICGWLLFGLLCGYGIALRSTLTLMAGLAFVLPWLSATQEPRSRWEPVRAAGMILLGLMLPILLLSLRNLRAIGSFSPLPTNGGIVLHQRYNPDNPTADNWIPSFVSYSHPIDIQRGYTQEAQRRLGRAVSPREVDTYWRGQAMSYIFSHPSHVAGNILRKFALFIAYPEIPNDRSLTDERLFSPVLNILPSPFGWLLAMGVPGFALLLWHDRRGWLVLAPIATVVFIVSVFDAIDRFRFQAVPLFALGTGLFLEYLVEYLKQKRIKQSAIVLTVAAALGALSVSLAGFAPFPQTRWDRAIFGYLKMGKREEAKALAMRALEEQPGNFKIQQALGAIAVSEGDDAGAVNFYRRAVELKPDSFVDQYNLAVALVKVGLRREAMEHAAMAVRIFPNSENKLLLQRLTEGK
jgi:tetratricopeptide (TPR) repeat protein